MNRTIISIAGTLAVSLGLTGCMASNPTHFDSMAAAMAPTTQLSEQEKRSTPTFSDETLATRYDSLLEGYREFRQAPDTYFSTVDAKSTCTLREAGRWLVTHGKPKSDIRAMRARQDKQFQTSTETTITSASLIEGECHDGIPEGPFVGTGEYRQVTSWDGGTPMVTHNSVRIEGTAVDGKMNGEFLSFSRSVVDSQSNVAPEHSITLSASAAQVDNGRDTGAQLIVTGKPQSRMVTTLVRRNTQTALGNQTEIQTYQGSRLTNTLNQLNDVPHGWMTNHLMPAGQQRTCMYRGEATEDSRCAGLALPAIASESIPEDALEQLVRNDNQGEYMSPYTSDGVLAEWVNMGSSADIGGTVGSGVGAAAGSMIADKALESLPFGSFLGGIVGSKVGEEMGREAGISAAGGWETIRATSDRSFDSLTDMARYLAQKYGNEPTYGDAIQVTLQVYPELQNAMASAY